MSEQLEAPVDQAPAGGALLQVNDDVDRFFATRLNLQPGLTGVLGTAGYELLGVGFFALLAFLLFRTARRSHVSLD